MNFWLLFIVVVVSFAVNFFNARYIKYISENKILLAAVYSELVVLAYSFNILTYIENKWYLVPMIIGGFAGTLLSTRKINKSEKKL